MENERHSAGDSLPEVSDIVETHNMVDQMTSQVDDSSGSGQTLASQVLPGNMPNDAFVYRQDVVSCSKFEGLLGVVMEVAGDSDSDGSITDDCDDSEDNGDACNGGDASKGGDKNNTDGDDDNDSLPDGQVRVAWTDGSETTDNITDITVVDRGFLHGDIVASAANPSGQLGLVVDVSITVDLLSANGEVIKSVNSKDLKRIREFTVGDYVVKGPWLGRVDDVLDNVTVLFEDGSICKVVKADPLRLQPVSKPVIDDSGCPYYPGQRIRAVSSSVFKSSRWLSGLWKANRLEGTVINVQTASVVVYWIASAYVGVDTNSSTVPSEEQNPKNLTLLDCFSYSNWQLGDWCLLPSTADGTSKGSKLKEPVNGIGEHTDTNMNSCSESSVQCFCSTDLVNAGTQTSTSEELNTLANVMDEEGVEYDSHDQQSASGANIDDCFRNSTPRESKSTDPMELDEGNVAASNLILLKDASSSIPSSVSKEAAANECWPSYRRKLRKVLFKRDKKGRRRDETFERALFIINTLTKVDVAWQDGTKEYGLDSTSLIPVQTPNDHDFFPEQYVVEKSADEGEDTSDTKHTGIVRTLNAKDKTVCVRWFKPVARPEDSREFDYDEVVSAYELDGHPDYDYCYGDVVVRLSPVLYTANTSDLEGATGHKVGNLSDMQSNDDRGQNLPSDEACEDFTSLSWVGNITGLRDGDIEVTWADGMVSKVGPQAIYVVGRDDDGDSFGGGSEVSNDGASWETVDENDMNTLEGVENVDSLNEDAELSSSTDVHPGSPPHNSNLGRNGPLSIPLAALSYVTRLASGFFSRGKKESDSECLSEIGNALRENLVASEELNHVTSDALDSQNHTQKVLETAETADTEMTEDVDMSTPVGRNGDSILEESLDGFKHFDIAENPLDHYFLGSSGGQGLGGRKWVKKVQQEWSILEKNLPDAIFVRVFEDRMDLLRAVIIGAPGTPYQDGLFFFDFYLLPEYPLVPPSVYYHSGGLRVNPNLYVDGKVCLSLLNTWTGKGNEVWDPSSSSILQVLVSLQGLVLNSKPYFNEAGYDKQVGTIEGEKNSLPYNENTYLLNLKSMMYLLRRPPMFFEGFIRDHFRQCGHYILKACEAYMGGCTIGSLTKDACLTEKSNEYPCSVGFKLMLAKILPRLITALTEVGVDCHHFEHLRASNILPTA